MGAPETPPEEVLRAAAAEVSTPSAKRRLRLFRNTLPPLLAKATDSASDTTLLVDLIFQTLPLYDDRASRKAVDDMVIRALTESTFMKPFAAALVQSMEKNLKVTSPLACFKLLRWSSYLLKWTQFATLSKGGFSRLANAQAVLSQVLMDGSFRQRRTCKQLFIRLFSESVEIYKMYIEEVRDSRISTRDSPAFINLILDFTIASSSLLSEYKPVFLDLYVKTILSSKDRPSEAASEAFKPLFLDIGHEDFKNVVLPSCIKMLKRNPEIVLQSIRHILMTVRLDLSNYSMEFMPVVLHQARHSDEERRINALSIVATLSDKSSDPDTLPFMFNAIKAILGGSEGKLSLPYQRVGMLNALEQLSRFSPKQISRLAPSVSSLLLTCYKGDVIEEVKLAALSSLGSWASVSSEAVQPDVVSFITAGLKEKDTLRKGHLKLILVICKKSDSLTKITPLLDHLIQLSKTGFTKATQRLDGIYALYAICRLAAIDAKADGSIVKEKLWPMIAKSEPSVISLQLLSKLTDEDCLTCVDLLQSLLVDHLLRVKEHFSVKSLLQVLIYLVCHQSWEVRKMAYDATKKVMSSSSALAKKSRSSSRALAEDLLFLFTDWLSLVGEEVSSSGDSQLPFIPSTEVLVKCLFLIAPYVVDHGPRSYSQLILCSHHPSISRSGSPAGVWKRLQRRLKVEKIFLTDLIFPNISVICKQLLSQDGLFSSNKQEQRATLCSLSTLMTISPKDTFTEFEKHFIELPYRALHNDFSENDIKIFFTSEGQLSAEQEIYCDVQKKKLLEEEASIRKDVGDVQKNVAVMLGALGELAIANPIFTRSYLSRLVIYIEPFLSSPIVSDAAFCALLRLARCTAPPMCNYANDIAAALCVTSVKKTETILDLMPVIMEEDSKKSRSGLFERIVSKLTVACKEKSLPADTFTFIFPILEMILLSSTKTSMHDDVFHILSMHLDPTLTLPRARMLSVLYHVLSTLHDDFPSIGQMLNDLCLGLTCSDLAQALVGIYAKEVHVRHACLTAIKCVPIHSVQQDLLVSTDLWIAVHDPEKVVAELAKDLWDRFGFDVCTDYSRIIDALSHKNYNVRAAAAEALTAALDENPEKIQDMLSTLISLYIRDLGPESEFGDSNWLGRQGIALALHSVSNVLGFKDLLVIMKFLMSHGLDDRNLDVRNRMMNIVILIIDKHGKENVSLLIPIFESCLNKMATDEETHKLFRKCFRVFISGVANYVSEGDPQVHNAFEKLLDQLNTPSANLPRNMLMDLPYVPFIEHLQSVGDSLFDVVYFSEPVAAALKAGWFVSLGGIGLEFYHMLFAMIESPHSRRKCLQRFKPEDVRYIPSLKRLVLSERIREIPYSSEMYRHNVQDVGEVLRCFRYDPKKVDKHEPDIFEIQRDRSKLPPYLSTLVSEIANMGSAIDGLTPKWRSLYDLDLAGKSSAAKIALILGVDLHYDYLPTSNQKDNLRNCLGEVTSSWKDLAEGVPSLKAILDFPYWNKEEKKWDKVNYNGFSVHSLWKCGRNHQTHSNGNQLSEKEAEAIFSFLFHVTLSKITKVIIETYKEPTPDEKKKQNKIKILEILHLK